MEDFVNGEASINVELRNEYISFVADSHKRVAKKRNKRYQIKFR